MKTAKTARRTRREKRDPRQLELSLRDRFTILVTTKDAREKKIVAEALEEIVPRLEIAFLENWPFRKVASRIIADRWEWAHQRGLVPFEKESRR